MITFDKENYTREEVFALVKVIFEEIEHPMNPPVNDYFQGANDARLEMKQAQEYVLENLREQKDGQVEYIQSPL